MWWSFDEVVRGILNARAASRSYRNMFLYVFVDVEGDSVLVMLIVIISVKQWQPISFTSSAVGRQDRPLHIGHWDDAMYLKLPVNSFLSLECLREEMWFWICANSEFTSFAGTCVKFSKFGVCETQVLAFSLSVDGSNFRRFFLLSLVHPRFDSVTIFFFHVSILRNISCFWFLNWIKKFPLFVFSLSTYNFLSEGYHCSNCCYFV